MALLSISNVAAQVKLRPSAIRYYEHIGLLLPPQRVGGQRRYDSSVLYRLAVIQRARESGFTLDEIRELFFGFRDTVPASSRWIALSQRKLTELRVQIDKIRTMQQLLQRMMTKCSCDTLEKCGKGIFQSDCADSGVKSRPKK
jgi:MerR family transcriptional regulator, redox-sensitive transcriptional activator SoxR